jgi:GNAT superfamily N-acetyltransferase
MNTNLSKQQFKEYTLEYKGADEQGGHNIVAKKEDKPIGAMRWAHGRGVDSVDVNPEHQRKGVATAMWNMAIDLKKQEGRYYPPENILKFEGEE